MADWTNLPNQAVGVGGLPSGTTVTALRDNPVAIAEGAAGAPRIQPSSAVEWAASTNTAAERNWVLARNAGAGAGAVGTYVFAGTRNNFSQDAEFGQTQAGSRLRPAGLRSADSFEATGILSADSFTSQSSTALSGTWRCMGRNNPNASNGAATLWLRIS